jgi:hypothetical protein
VRAKGCTDHLLSHRHSRPLRCSVNLSPRRQERPPRRRLAGCMDGGITGTLQRSCRINRAFCTASSWRMVMTVSTGLPRCSSAKR